MEELIKIESKVIFVDGSYTLTIKNKTSKLEHEYGKELIRKGVCTVIAVNVSCPTHFDGLTDELLKYQNNCIVQSSKGDIIFCSKINIKSYEDNFKNI